MATPPLFQERSAGAPPAGSSVTDVVEKPRPLTPPGRVAMWALILGLGGFLLWAGLAPLDEGVPGQGMVTIDTKSKAVQHLAGGIIKDVLVKEGQEVQQGQVLIRLDEGVALANFEAARQRYLGMRAMEARLQAERLGSSKVVWHPDLQQALVDPQIRLLAQTQEYLLQSRRLGLQAELQSIEENVQGQLAMLQSYASMLASRRTQLALLNEELRNTRELVKEGYTPRNRQLELERMTSEVSATLAELTGNTTRAERAVSELRQRALARQQEYRKDVESQLAEVGREVQADAQKFQALKEELSRLEIKAPASGQVVGLAFQTVGGVVGPGQKLMDIVPENQALLLEARVPPNLIDRVRAGQPVDVRFSTFANAPQLVVDAQVASVSGDLLTDAHTGAGYYLARVAVTPAGLRKLGQRALRPGMPVEVVFLTGERSLLTYLLHPLTRRMAASMKEE
jgi:protease secretion system membrane fusion protein